ncbi:MAG: phosphoketolase [Candidatus Levybacteria bacterium]|nr:phosphoketolase [Candidatus Levybacteria bacterium]
MNKAIENITRFVRAANYLTVTQIYLQDNFLLEKPLAAKDIKQRLFGHWGTCPGINFVYAHLNYLVKQHNQSTIFLLGPGHGFPALQANLFLEGTLQKYYPKATLDEKGIAYVSKMFSWPYGVSSHSNPEAPGLILEGGELGYSLSTAFGAVLDNPDLLAVCMIGDGEAETGSIATAWHLNKLIDPAINGAVLPILHVNGYKISGPTIFGRMSDEELTALFTGYGYEPFFVKGDDDVYVSMMDTLETCYQRIKAIQKNAREKGMREKPRFPMIILQTAKGWTGVKELNNKKIEGNILAHQVVAPNARKDEAELEAIAQWLQSYKFEELFDKKTGFLKEIFTVLPDESLRIGDNPHVYSKRMYKKLQLPKVESLAKAVKEPGKLESQSMRLAGKYLAEVFTLNEKEKNFRLFSPDETYSNRLDDVFRVTNRAFVWGHDADDKHMAYDGRVMEMLSEHNLQGLAQGYILTGRHGVFTTYEAFAQIFSSMTHQYEKFLKVARTMPWRGDVASMNYLFSSVLWRQEHNGFTHQNPSFISGVLEKHDCNIAVYFPIDANSMLAVLSTSLASVNGINTIVAGKTIEPLWISLDKAKETLKHGGIATWEFASDKNPDIVIVGIGDYVTKEAMAAIEMVKISLPEIKIRFVNIQKLIGKCQCTDTKHPQIPHAIEHLTEDKPVIINFHGYAETIAPMFFDVANPQRFSIHGYEEQGGTTTPFDMHVRNKTSRYHIAIEILEKMEQNGVITTEKAENYRKKYQDILENHYTYVTTYGVDPIEFEQWHWDNKNMQNDDSIQLNILQKSKTIAIVGLSTNPDRYSYQVAQYLQEKGYRIIPVTPTHTEVLGEKAYKSLLDIPKDIPIDIVALYRKSEEVVPHIEEIIQRGNISTIWLPEGVRNTKGEALAREQNILTISDFCIMKQHQKLSHQ